MVRASLVYKSIPSESFLLTDRDSPMTIARCNRGPVNAMTNIAVPQVVRRVRLPVCAEFPDFFPMIDEQATMVVKLARTVGEVLQCRESAHSLRLLDLEQRRQELRRRNQAAVHFAVEQRVAVEQIRGTMEALDRAAARLFQAARGFQLHLSVPDQAASEMMAVIQKAIEKLQHGYSRLANGSPAAEVDADAAIGSGRALGKGGRTEAIGERPGREGSPLGRALWLDELHANLQGSARELAEAGAILKDWSRQLSAGLSGCEVGDQTVARLSRRLVAN